jgi:hypothetical protein
MEKLIPYCLYLPEDHVKKIKKMAKARKASAFIRDAVLMALDKTDDFSSGYNKGLTDASGIVYGNPEAKIVVIKGRYLCDILGDKIKKLKQEPK